MAVAAALAAAAVYVVVVPKSCERFIVISQQRSGSSYLVDALDGHPDLACADEIFAKRSGTDTGDWAAVDATWIDRPRSLELCFVTGGGGAARAAASLELITSRSVRAASRCASRCRPAAAEPPTETAPPSQTRRG